MAEKKTELSIVLRTVDRATAGIKAVNDRIKAITKPIGDFKAALGDLRKNSGLDEVIGGFKGVGSAIAGLLAKLAMIGGVAGFAVAGVFHLIKEFDDLGDKAERMGVTVDFLAEMRYAAEKAGAPVEALDEGLMSFSQNLGQLRANTGRMNAFLTKVSPALRDQLKGAKSNEQAFYLLANAMKKIEDPAKRAALAQKTVGDAALAPLLAGGGKQIQALATRYLELAGSQEDAAQKAGETDDSMHDAKASIDGVKAAIVSGLAPALTVLIKRMTEWLSGHREQLREWAEAVGTRLPGAAMACVEGIKAVIAAIEPFIERLGGAKAVALALGAFIAGPLVAAVVTLGVALMTTPVGWVIAGLAAMTAAVSFLSQGCRVLIPIILGIGAVFAGLPLVSIPMAFIAAATLIVKYWSPIGDFFKMLWDAIMAIFDKAWEFIKAIVDKIVGAVSTVMEAGSDVKGILSGKSASELSAERELTGSHAVSVADQHLRDYEEAKARRRAAAQATTTAATAAPAQSAKIDININGAPPGTRATVDPKSTADVDLGIGYQRLVAGLMP